MQMDAGMVVKLWRWEQCCKCRSVESCLNKLAAIGWLASVWQENADTISWLQLGLMCLAWTPSFLSFLFLSFFFSDAEHGCAYKPQSRTRNIKHAGRVSYTVNSASIFALTPWLPSPVSLALRFHLHISPIKYAFKATAAPAYKLRAVTWHTTALRYSMRAEAFLF